MSALPTTTTAEEEAALEGLFFSEHDIGLYLKGDLSAERLAVHLNAYIVQAYRVGKVWRNER
jgi:hypothetical protein